MGDDTSAAKDEGFHSIVQSSGEGVVTSESQLKTVGDLDEEKKEEEQKNKNTARGRGNTTAGVITDPYPTPYPGSTWHYWCCYCPAPGTPGSVAPVPNDSGCCDCDCCECECGDCGDCDCGVLDCGGCDCSC